MEKGFEKLDAYPSIPIFYSQKQENPGEIEQIWHDYVCRGMVWQALPFQKLHLQTALLGWRWNFISAWRASRM